MKKNYFCEIYILLAFQSQEGRKREVAGKSGKENYEMHKKLWLLHEIQYLTCKNK